MISVYIRPGQYSVSVFDSKGNKLFEEKTAEEAIAFGEQYLKEANGGWLKIENQRGCLIEARKVEL